MNRVHLPILLTVIGLEVAIRAAIIAGAGAMTDQGFYSDDSFMSHQMASTVAKGAGITQAGQPTNGFQPLFVFLLVPLYWVFGHTEATVASAVMTSGFSVAGSYLLFRLLHKLFSRRVGLIGLVLWAISPYLTRVGLNGLETSLAHMLMLALLCMSVAGNQKVDCFKASQAVSLGVVSGLALLARTDLGLLIVLTGFDQICTRIRRRQFRQLAVFLLTGAAVIAPWFIWSRAACGSFIPVSGAATRTISQLYGSPAGPSPVPAYFPLGEVPITYYGSNVAQALRQLVIQAPLSAPAIVLTGERVDVAVAWLVAILIAACACRSTKDGMNGRDWKLSWLIFRMWFAWVFLLLLIATYCFYYFAQWHFWRYLSPGVVLLIMPSALLIDRIWTWSAERSFGLRTTAVFGAVAVTVMGHLAMFKSPDSTGIARRLYQDAIYLRDHLDPAARVGSFESGTLDYFLDQDVYNLDGKTNAGALEALVNGRMDLLIRNLQLDFVVSSPFLIRDLLDRRGQWQPGQLSLVDRLSLLDVVSVADPSNGTEGG